MKCWEGWNLSDAPTPILRYDVGYFRVPHREYRTVSASFYGVGLLALEAKL